MKTDKSGPSVLTWARYAESERGLSAHRAILGIRAPHLLIIDELGMENLNYNATELLLEIIHRRYQRKSIIIATNRPIEDWGKILGDNAAASAILDRFLENVHIIQITGKSYRLKNA